LCTSCTLSPERTNSAVSQRDESLNSHCVMKVLCNEPEHCVKAGLQTGAYDDLLLIHGVNTSSGSSSKGVSNGKRLQRFISRTYGSLRTVVLTDCNCDCSD
jgi:hypothetical protein